VCGQPAATESSSPAPPSAAGGDAVTLSREELVRLVADAVARFAGRQT
jgi:hypothetical protein